MYNNNKTCDLHPIAPCHQNAPGYCGYKKMLGVQSFIPVWL